MNLMMASRPKISSPAYWEQIALNELPDSIFVAVHEEIIRDLPDLGNLTENAKRLRYRIELAGIRSRPVDYDLESLSFNQAFFFRNFYKCLCLLSADRTSLASDFVADLGAGAGPFALAATLMRGVEFQRLIIIDQSHSQLSLARSIFSTKGIRGVNLKNASLFEAAPPAEYHRISSYWLCDSEFLGNYSDIKNHLLIGHGALLLDYPDILEAVVASLDRSAFECRLLSLSVRPGHAVRSILEKDDVSIYGLSVTRR